MRYSHTVAYYSAIERNEILTQVTTWMNLENMLSEKKPVTNSHKVCDSIRMNCSEQANSETEIAVIGENRE